MSIEDSVEGIASATDWNARVALIRLIPEKFGTAKHQEVYSAVAKRVYVPTLAPDFAYIHWDDDYELPLAQSTYDLAFSATAGFTKVSLVELAATLETAPTTLRVFRLILGFTAQEFAAATALVVGPEEKAVTTSRIRAIEGGASSRLGKTLNVCASVIDQSMRRELFGPPPSDDLRLKTDKPDTRSGWQTVRQYASEGVPLSVFLHQRQYGGAFRQLLDATSSKRGDLIEDAVTNLLAAHQVPHIRTGSNNQEEIVKRFGLTVKPAPDFVAFDQSGALRAILECKGANDGGTARDKAARFRALRQEATRLGGVPLFGVLAGLGWTRTTDALGPVVRETDGRTFTIPTLKEMITVDPFPALIGTQF
jgi:hypothetical protein